MTFELDDQTITIVGYVDAYEPDSATVYDLKTTRFVKWQAEKGHIPRENHVTQYHALVERRIILNSDGCSMKSEC
jgi:hypothetical protein